MVCILWFSHSLGMVPPWQCYVHGWLIYHLCLVFQLSRWLMCFGYCTYSKSLNVKLMRLFRRRRLRRVGTNRDWRLNIQYIQTQMNSLIKTQGYISLHSSSMWWKHMILQLLRSLFTALSNIAARVNHLHYCACVQFILLQGRCSSSCSEDLWSLQMKWKTLKRRRDFDRTGGGEGEHKARWLRGSRDRDEKTRDFIR